MKVKGWAVIRNNTQEVVLITFEEPEIVDNTGQMWIVKDYKTYEGYIQTHNDLRGRYEFNTLTHKVKPCTITINNKAVGK